MYIDFTLQLNNELPVHTLSCDIDFREISDMCEALSSYIFDKYNDVFIRNILNDYEFIDINDKINVLESIENKLKSDSFYKKTINEHLLDYLCGGFGADFIDSDAEYKIKLNIDGFAIFRLKEYREILKNELENTIDEYYIKKEEIEFIELLKYFVMTQSSLIEEIHIVSDFSGRYYVRQKNFCELSESCLKAIYEEFEPEEMTEDDLLLSALITLAPKKIYIHMYENVKDKKIFDTILKVFENNCIICNGCIECRKLVKT